MRRLCCVVGPAETVRQFVKELQDEGTFAKEVNSAGVAFHSPAVRLAAPAMRKALSKVWWRHFSFKILFEFYVNVKYAQ